MKFKMFLGSHEKVREIDINQEKIGNNYYENKKVLLRESKGHTARGVESMGTPSSI